MNTEPLKKRRGRRKKSEMESEKKEPTAPKKRGRKPKGGKLTIKMIIIPTKLYHPIMLYYTWIVIFQT